MLSWQVGRVKITRIVEMDLPVPARVIPQATAEELRKLAWLYSHFVSEDDSTLKLSIHALLVEAPGLKLVVDTCVGNDQTMLGDSVKPIFDAGLVELVELNHVISPELRLMPSIGDTPGHVSVMIESEGERAVITGDMAHHPCQMAHPDWSIGDNDRKAAALTRSRLFAEWADQPILVIGTHFAAPTAGRVLRDGAAFRFAV